MIIKTKNGIIAELEGKNKKLIQENENLKDAVKNLEGELGQCKKSLQLLRWQSRILLVLVAIFIIYVIFR